MLITISFCICHWRGSNNRTETSSCWLGRFIHGIQQIQCAGQIQTRSESHFGNYWYQFPSCPIWVSSNLERWTITLCWICSSSGEFWIKICWKNHKLIKVPSHIQPWYPDTYIRNGWDVIVEQKSLELNYDGTFSLRQKYQATLDLDEKNKLVGPFLKRYMLIIDFKTEFFSKKL